MRPLPAATSLRLPGGQGKHASILTAGGAAEGRNLHNRKSEKPGLFSPRGLIARGAFAVALCAGCSAALNVADAPAWASLLIGIPLGLVVTRLVFE